MLDENLERLTCDLLKKGVAVNSYIVRTRNGEKRIFDIDFFAHDKVFEDKITELEHIINHKLGNWDKLGITYQEILDMKAENEKLTQRIAELEKKKRKRPCFVSYVGVEEINGKEYVSMEKFATAMEELNAYFDKFFDS